MTPLFQAALELQNFFLKREWRFCIIGGIALLRWGEPRYTRDVDATLLTGFGNEDLFIEPVLSSSYRGRIPDAAEFARKNRVLLIESPEGVPIDIALGGLPFEALAIDRATSYDFEPDCVLTTCSAEDLMVMKLFAFRPRDVLDVEGIAVRQRGRLDWDYVETQLTPLAELKEQPDILRALARFKQQDEPR
jgi:hypothetical protein